MASGLSRKRRGGAPRGEGARAGHSDAPRKRVPGLASPAGESPGRLSALRPPRNFCGGDAQEPGASRRGGKAARACKPNSTIQETPMFQTKVTFADGSDARAAQGARRTLAARGRAAAHHQQRVRLLAGVRRSRCAAATAPARTTCTPASTRHWRAMPEDAEGMDRAAASWPSAMAPPEDAIMRAGRRARARSIWNCRSGRTRCGAAAHRRVGRSPRRGSAPRCADQAAVMESCGRAARFPSPLEGEGARAEAKPSERGRGVGATNRALTPLPDSARLSLRSTHPLLKGRGEARALKLCEIKRSALQAPQAFYTSAGSRFSTFAGAGSFSPRMRRALS